MRSKTRVLLWIEGSVNDQGIAIEDAMINHPVALDLHEEGSSRVFDEMLIKAEVCGGADDGEHQAVVSHKFGAGIAFGMPSAPVTICFQPLFKTVRQRVSIVVD